MLFLSSFKFVCYEFQGGKVRVPCSRVGLPYARGHLYISRYPQIRICCQGNNFNSHQRFAKWKILILSNRWKIALSSSLDHAGLTFDYMWEGLPATYWWLWNSPRLLLSLFPLLCWQSIFNWNIGEYVMPLSGIQQNKFVLCSLKWLLKDRWQMKGESPYFTMPMANLWS